MRMVMKKLKIWMVFITLLLTAEYSLAAVMIDDFTDFQAATNETQGPLGVNGSQLSNLARTLTATPSLNAETEVVVESGALSIANNSDSTGTASIYYSFDPVDLTVGSDALVLDLDFIDLFHEIQIIANNSSVYGFANLTGVGEYLIGFSQFTNPLVFKQLTSLELKFRGDKAWDAVYGALSTNTTVPEPSVIALLSLGLMVLSRTQRKAIA